MRARAKRKRKSVKQCNVCMVAVEGPGSSTTFSDPDPLLPRLKSSIGFFRGSFRGRRSRKALRYCATNMSVRKEREERSVFAITGCKLASCDLTLESSTIAPVVTISSPCAFRSETMTHLSATILQREFCNCQSCTRSNELHAQPTANLWRLARNLSIHYSATVFISKLCNLFVKINTSTITNWNAWFHLEKESWLNFKRRIIDKTMPKEKKMRIWTKERERRGKLCWCGRNGRHFRLRVISVVVAHVIRIQTTDSFRVRVVVVRARTKEKEETGQITCTSRDHVLKPTF